MNYLKKIIEESSYDANLISNSISESLSKKIEEELLSNKSIDYFCENDIWLPVKTRMLDSYKYTITLKNTKRIKHVGLMTYANVIDKNLIGLTVGNKYFGVITPLLILKHNWKLTTPFNYECKSCGMKGSKNETGKFIIPHSSTFCKNKVILDIID